MKQIYLVIASTSYLKGSCNERQFGKGYFLTVTKDQDIQQFPGGVTATKFSADRLTQFITAFIRGASLHDAFGPELTFLLPKLEESNLPRLLVNLDQNLKQFGIKSYGMTDTPLEEVFLKACSEELSYGNIVDLNSNVTSKLSQFSPVKRKCSVNPTIDQKTTQKQKAIDDPPLDAKGCGIN